MLLVVLDNLVNNVEQKSLLKKLYSEVCLYKAWQDFNLKKWENKPKTFFHIFSVRVDIWQSLVEQMFGTNNLNQICFLLYQILTKRMLVGICLQTI